MYSFTFSFICRSFLPHLSPDRDPHSQCGSRSRRPKSLRNYRAPACGSGSRTPVIYQDWNSCFLAVLRQLLPGCNETAIIWLSWNSCSWAGLKQLLPGWSETAITGTRLRWNSCSWAELRQLLPYRAGEKQLLPGRAGTAVVGLD
jgi:hypothetical protein